jgi:elongation factor G
MAHGTQDIRNLVFLGHAGSGKTSLVDAILHVTGANTRLGSVDDGSSVSDFEAEEKERKQSIDSHVLHAPHAGKEINLIDAPGMPDFINGAIGAMAAAEIGVVVVSATAGIEVNTRRLYAQAKNNGLARIVVVNKCDSDNLNLPALVAAIQETFGRECKPVNVPDSVGDGLKAVLDCVGQESGGGVIPVGEAHTQLLDAIAETDEKLMEKYLGGEKLGADQVAGAMVKAIAAGALVPILFTAARKEIGIRELLEVLVKYAPSPADLLIRKAKKADGTVDTVKPDPNAPFVGQVFKITHPQRGKMAFVRVLAGKLKPDTAFSVRDARATQKAGHVYKSQGAEQAEVQEIVAGDIGVLLRLDMLKLHDLLHVDNTFVEAVPPVYPIPMFSLAVEPKSRGDVDKVSGGLGEIAAEDKTFVVSLDNQTGERIINGLGELHLRLALNRLKRKRGLEVNTKPPKIPYRETITQSAKYVDYTHKKQTGGAGQFARVAIDMEPNERGKGYEFIDAIYGGSVSQSFRPSVDKGIQQKMVEGVLAGYPVVDFKVSLVDGKEHPVDSKDIAFQIAGREVFKKAIMSCKPVILEPIVNIEVTVPADMQGTINGQLSSRRGRIVGADSLPGNMAVVKATIPLAEVLTYGSQLQSATGGQGSYTIEFSHYDPVPGNVQQQLIAAFKPKEEAD